MKQGAVVATIVPFFASETPLAGSESTVTIRHRYGVIAGMAEGVDSLTEREKQTLRLLLGGQLPRLVLRPHAVRRWVHETH